MMGFEWLKPAAFLGSILYAIIGVIIFWLAFVIVDKITPYDLWREIVEKQNQALGLVVAGMAAWGLLRREHLGWRLDFATRELAPVGVDGEPRRLDGPGWGLYCVGGSKRRSLALEFRHEDGGKALRVLETRGGASREEHQLVSQIADALAQRLQLRREGLSL